MDGDISYRLMQPGEEAEVCDLVVSVFNELIGYRYPPEGVREFSQYAEPSLLRERFLSHHFTLVATQNGRIAGMIEVRDESHICLFFVDKRLHGRGIGRGLFERALERCRQSRPERTYVDVNSSANAVEIYESLGFNATGPETTINGITFVPMALTLPAPPGIIGKIATD